MNQTSITTESSASEIISGLKLLAVEVGVSATDPNQTGERLNLFVANEPARRTFTVRTNSDEEVFIRVEESKYRLQPREINNIARELAEYLNAQLFAIKQPLRIVSVEYTWKEESGVENITRLSIPASVWESTLTDPRATQTAMIIRPELLEVKLGDPTP